MDQISKEHSSSCQTDPLGDFVFDLADAVRVQGQSSQFTDVIVQVEGEDFNTHRFFLSAFSGFFQALFKSGMRECQNNSVVLEDISKDVFRQILKFVFEGEIHLNSSNLYDVCKAADMLQIQPLMKHCKHFLHGQDIGAENCFEVYEVAKIVDNDIVKSSAWSFIIEHFDDILDSEKDNFLSLDHLEMEALIKDDKLLCKTEDSIVEFLLEWVSYDPAITVSTGQKAAGKSTSLFSVQPTEGKSASDYPRVVFLKDLLSSCRIFLLTDSYLINTLSQNVFVKQISEVDKFVSKCTSSRSIKIEGNMCDDGSSIMSIHRDITPVKNVIVAVTNDHLCIFHNTDETSQDISHDLIKIDEVDGHSVSCAFWDGKIASISSKGTLNLLVLDEIFMDHLDWECYECLVTPMTKVSKSHDDHVGMIVVANKLYIVGEHLRDAGDFHIEAEGYEMDCHMLPLTPGMKDFILAKYKNEIIVFGCATAGKTAIQCIGLQNHSSYMLDDIEENYIFSHDSKHVFKPQTFSTIEDTFILYPSGSLWKLIEKEETGRLECQFVMKCWSYGNVALIGANLLNEKLVVFIHDSAKQGEPMNTADLTSVSLSDVFQNIIVMLVNPFYEKHNSEYITRPPYWNFANAIIPREIVTVYRTTRRQKSWECDSDCSY